MNPHKLLIVCPVHDALIRALRRKLDRAQIVYSIIEVEDYSTALNEVLEQVKHACAVITTVSYNAEANERTGLLLAKELRKKSREIRIIVLASPINMLAATEFSNDNNVETFLTNDFLDEGKMYDFISLLQDLCC